MGRLLRVHKIIIGFSAIGLILALCLHIYVTEPAGQDYETLSGEVQDLRKQLKKLKAPAGESQQSALRSELMRRQEVTTRLERQVSVLYESVYAPVIQRNNWSLGSFVRQSPKPTRDFYMKEFDRILRASSYGDLTQDNEHLGLTRDSDSPERYQQLLQLWCVESLLRQAHESNLKLVWEKLDVREQEGNQRTFRNGGRERDSRSQPAHRVPALRILPSTEIVSVQGKTGKAEFLELRFRLGVTGHLPGIDSFVRSLSSRGTFFGIGAFELMQLPPPRGTVSGGMLQLNVECVTFVPLTRT